LTTLIKALHSSIALAIFVFQPTLASEVEVGGHAKAHVLAQSYPADSVFNDLVGATSADYQGDLRLNLEAKRNNWTLDVGYQLIGLSSDLLRVPNDDRRLLNLTATIDESGSTVLLHRLDRLWVGYTGERTVVRFGRQALSWGNSLFYAPMDLVNPFDPSAVDTEYKAGDDMLYLQYLRDTGDDVQAAHVIRRGLLSGDVDADAATTAVKYHGFAGEKEFDVLIARHYGDTVFGLGFGRSVGGAQWGSDVVVTATDSDTVVQLSTNLSYSWVAAGRNMSGAVEYHFNGFGQSSGRYGPGDLASNPELLLRLNRGEIFTAGRHYIAGSVLIEMTPLWSVSPTLLGNLTDPSGLLQLVTNYSLSDNMTLLGSLNVPFGSNGSEFGGPASLAPGRYFSQDAGLFAQFAWYF